MLSRIRYFFEDVGYWFSDRLGSGRRRKPRPGPPEAGADAGEAPKADGAATAAATAAVQPPAPEPARPPKPKRRLFHRRKAQGAVPAEAAKPEGVPPAASAPDTRPGVAPDPSKAETAQLPPAPAAKRSRFGRPSLPRPSLPRPRLPRPRRPHLRRPGRRGVIAGAIVLLAGAVAAVYLATGFEFGDDASEAPPAPRIVIEEGDEAPNPERAPELGFPAFATKNTTRVSGADPVADAAGVALATAPATGGIDGPAAVSVVAEDDWPAAIAAASLVAEPVRAPILLSGEDEVPELTLTALTELAPKGSPQTDDDQLFRFGDALAPEGLRARDIDGANPAEVAAAAAAERERLTGKKPEHVVLASSDRPEFAMPAASWSARSGDPVLFVQGDSVPTPTLEALRGLEDVPIYALGPEPVVSDEVLDQIAKETDTKPKRIGEDDAVSNAIAFARYSDGSFGWNVADPGHGLVLANATRPADAGAAAPLSASGKWGPLLLTDNANVLPAPLEGYLLDIKPGYVEDPTRAVYNHAWLIGDTDAISVDVQAQVDDLLELAKVQSGRGQDTGTLPGQGAPESEPDQGDDQP